MNKAEHKLLDFLFADGEELSESDKLDIFSDDLPDYVEPREAYIQSMADYHFRQELDEQQQEAMEVFDDEE